MTQEEADVLVNELQNAIDSLEKAPTVSTDTKMNLFKNHKLLLLKKQIK